VSKNNATVARKEKKLPESKEEILGLINGGTLFQISLNELLRITETVIFSPITWISVAVMPETHFVASDRIHLDNATNVCVFSVTQGVPPFL